MYLYNILDSVHQNQIAREKLKKKIIFLIWNPERNTPTQNLIIRH